MQYVKWTVTNFEDCMFIYFSVQQLENYFHWIKLPTDKKQRNSAMPDFDLWWANKLHNGNLGAHDTFSQVN
jgi:hypothetical protein